MQNDLRRRTEQIVFYIADFFVPFKIVRPVDLRIVTPPQNGTDKYILISFDLFLKKNKKMNKLWTNSDDFCTVTNTKEILSVYRFIQ